MQQPDWSTLDAWTWLRLAAVVLSGWAVLMALGSRLTRQMTWYGAIIIWGYLVAAGVGGTWLVHGAVSISLSFGRPLPHLGQMIVLFITGVVLWPYFFGLMFAPLGPGDRR